MKRPLAAVGGLLAFACLLLSAWALWWIWTVKQPTIDKTRYAFGKVEEALDLAERSVDQAKTNLTNARAQVGTVGYMTSSARANQQPGLVNSMVARVLAQQLAPSINDVQQSLERVTEASIIINSLLETVQDVEDLQVFEPSQVRSLQSQMGAVTKASVELGTVLESGHEGPESAEERSARVAANLDLVIGLLGDFEKGVSGLQSRVQRYKDKTLYWMELGPKLATAALVWVAISQLVVIVVAIRALRNSPAAA